MKFGIFKILNLTLVLMSLTACSKANFDSLELVASVSSNTLTDKEEFTLNVEVWNTSGTKILLPENIGAILFIKNFTVQKTVSDEDWKTVLVGGKSDSLKMSFKGMVNYKENDAITISFQRLGLSIEITNSTTFLLKPYLNTGYIGGRNYVWSEAIPIRFD